MKRLGSFLLALAMLCTLVPSAFAAQAEQYHFTASTEPGEIYATILRDYGETWAESYKHSLLFYTNAVNGDDVNEIDTDSHEIGPKDQYPWEARRAAIQSMSSIINNAEQVPMYADPEAQVFDDVEPGSWYYEAVNAMAAGGLLTGYTDGLFHPDDPITIAQYSTVFAKIYGIHSTEWTWGYAAANRYEPVYDQNGKLIDIKTGFCYVDENGNPYPGAVEPIRESHHWAQEDQLNIAFKAWHHSPLQHEVLDEPIIRGQMLTEMFTLYAAKYGASSAEKKWTLDDIPDSDTIKNSKDILRAEAIATGNWKRYAANNAWGQAGILRAYDAGVTTGIDDKHTCNPMATVTRAQFCQMLYNMGITTENSVPLPKGGLSG